MHCRMCIARAGRALQCGKKGYSRSMAMNGMSEHNRQAVSNALLEELRVFAAELHPARSAPSISLASRLDRDLGFDSLARAQLIARLEQRFGVRLPEEVFAEAETAAHLLEALITSSAEVATRISPPATSTAANAPQLLSPPSHAASLIDVLRHYADSWPQREHIRLYVDDGEGETITYGTLWDESRRCAAALQQCGLERGDTIGIMLPTGPAYFYTFFGVLLAGGVPVSLYPPVQRTQIEDHILRQRTILENCGARFLITVSEALPYARALRSLTPTLRDILDPLTLRSDAPWIDPRAAANDIAFLQYTSGTTGNPKGVVLTHANLLANIRAMGEAIRASSQDTFVNWLPLYHDMGLIGAWLGSLYFGCRLVSLSPLAFLARPQRWLWAIHHYRGTLSAAPNFAYELCLTRLGDAETRGLDLSSWRVAFNGAEAVSPETAEQFCARFAEFGFRGESYFPVYGLAECSVGLAFPPLGRGPVIDRVERAAFAGRGYAVAASGQEQNVLRFVACGRPLPGHEIRIADEAGRELPDRMEGNIQFRGPSSTAGYYRNPQATAALLRDGWLDSGDMGYIAGGDLYISGRRKDMIIRGGRNLYPQELEEAVGSLQGIRRGRVAVFGVADLRNRTEKLVVLAETRVHEHAARDDLTRAIAELGRQLVGGPPDDIVLAPPNTVLKTSSGKLRRAACRELYEQGQIRPRLPVWRQIVRVLPFSIKPLIQRAWRRASEETYSAYAWSVFTALACVGWLSVVLLPKLSLRWRAARALLHVLARATGTRFLVSGLEHLPPADQAFVLVANHGSYLDSFALIAALPHPVRFVAKSELRRGWLGRLLLERMDTEFVERFERKQSLADAQRLVEAVRQGRSLAFFPEGTFTRQGGLLPFRMGAFLAAAGAHAEIVPIAIRGTRSILRGDSWFIRHGKIEITVTEPISPGLDALDSSDAAWSEAVRLRDASRRAILANVGEPDLSPESPASAGESTPYAPTIPGHAASPREFSHHGSRQ